jgi:hypothetical protein
VIDMKNTKQKLNEMDNYLDTIGLHGRLREAFIGAFAAYLKSQQNKVVNDNG